MTHASIDPVDVADLERRRATLSPTSRLVLALVLGAALVAGVVGAVVLAARDSAATASTSAGSVDDEAAGRRAVQLAVATFAANLNDYSVEDIAGYQARLQPLLTPGFAKSFGLAVDGIVAEVESTRMTSQGNVVQTAVTSIDDDTATALVVADVNVTSALGDRERHFRWKVTLVHNGDAWLVDGFEPVA